MKASTERTLLRWVHIIGSIPIIGFIYGPVSEIPEAVFFIRFILFPIIAMTGLWMWKGNLIKKWFTNQVARLSANHKT